MFQKLPETKLRARLNEIFSAIQGKGLNVTTCQLLSGFALCELVLKRDYL